MGTACDHNAKFTRLFTCDCVVSEKDCGSPPAVSDSTQIIAPDTRYGATVTYACDRGFRDTSGGNLVLTCNASGMWDGPAVPSCDGEAVMWCCCSLL